MKTVSVTEKRATPAKRSFRPYYHQPASILQRIDQAALRKIIRPDENQIKQLNPEDSGASNFPIENDLESVTEFQNQPIAEEQAEQISPPEDEDETISLEQTEEAVVGVETENNNVIPAKQSQTKAGIKLDDNNARKKQPDSQKKQKVIDATEDGVETEKKSPASPDQDPEFQAVKNKSKKESRKQKRHAPASVKATAAQAAAKGPPQEVENTAKGRQLGKMEQQEVKAFDKKSFSAALLKRIKEITPKNLKQADNFKDSGKAKALKSEVIGNVEKSKQASQGDIQKTTAETPNQTGIKAKEATTMPATKVGTAPRGLRASRAAPKQKTESEVSLQRDSQSLDQEMIDADVTEQQLNNSNEPEFISALDSKKQAQQDADDAPIVFREEEQTILGGAKSQARGSAGFYGKSMHNQRSVMLEAVVNKQGTTKTEDEKKRVEISGNIQKIYKKTKKSVEDKLKKLDVQVNKIFDKGAEKARVSFEDYVADRMRKYKKKRYSGVKGKILWGKDLFFDLPSYVNTFYVKGRSLYIKAMTLMIDNVALAVETGLNDAKKTITKGRKSVSDYVDNLPKDLKKIGKGAADKIEADFDSLEQKVDDKQTQLIDSLARKYVDNLNKIDQRIKKMKEANKGLVSKAKDAVVGVINTVRKLKDMLLNVLARVASVIGSIIKAPIRFLGNLVKGVGLGLKNFMGNILTHLKKGLIGWLFGALEGAKINLPTTFDLKGIISIILQVLGLTYANFRARAVRILGEPFVKRLEQVAEIFKVVATEGAVGLWKWIKDKLTAIKETVWDGIMSFVKERIIVAGITWLIGLLNPAAAFIKACKMIYDIVMFFVNRGKQILSLVNAILNSIEAIVKGSVTVAATAVENALSKALPVAISFLASLLGLGGISQKIRNIIERVQRPVNKAMDFVIKKAAKAVGAVVSKGKDIGGKVFTWWKHRKQVLVGKKKINAYFNGDPPNSKFVISSSPAVSYKNYLSKVRVLQKTAEQKKAYSEAETIGSRLDKNLRKRKMEKPEADKQIADLNRFAELIKVLSGATALPPSVIRYGALTAEQGGMEAEAKILSKDSGGSKGTTPRDKPPIWTAVKKRKSDSNKRAYVQGHLLNHNVHGPGKRFNMTPITYAANSDHKNGIEKRIKELVLDKTDPKVVYYKVTAKYRGHPDSADYTELKNEPNRTSKQQKELDIMEADRKLASQFEFVSHILNPKDGKYTEKGTPISFPPVQNVIPKNKPNI